MHTKLPAAQFPDLVVHIRDLIDPIAASTGSDPVIVRKILEAAAASVEDVLCADKIVCLGKDHGYFTWEMKLDDANNVLYRRINFIQSRNLERRINDGMTPFHDMLPESAY